MMAAKPNTLWKLNGRRIVGKRLQFGYGAEPVGASDERVSVLECGEAPIRLPTSLMDLGICSAPKARPQTSLGQRPTAIKLSHGQRPKRGGAHARMREALWSAAALPYHYPHLFKPSVRDKGGTKKRVILSAVFEAKDLTGQDKSAQRRGVSGECQRAGPQLRDKLFTFELFGVYWEVLRFEDFAQNDSFQSADSRPLARFGRMWVIQRTIHRSPRRCRAEVPGVYLEPGRWP